MNLDAADRNISLTSSAESSKLRIPVEKLDQMSETVGELLISYERLSLYQEQLRQASLTLKKRIQHSDIISEQVRTLYDQLTTPMPEIISDGAETVEWETGGEEEWETGGVGEGENLSSHPQSLKSLDNEFDSLPLEQYSAVDKPLQNLQELMVQVQESRADIDLISAELQEELNYLHQQLDSLRTDLTQSRLIPFKLLAERFITPLQTLSQQYHKPVELVIVGKEILIDQFILEQLQTPLTHLLHNAFKHGIESAEERQSLGKPPTAKITLAARVQGNQVVIKVTDDGRGIDVQKVYQQAVQVGLVSPDKNTLKNSTSTPEQILEFLFHPSFSTAETVMTLSEGEAGLNGVKLQVERLRGLVRVKTKLGQGTKFTITIPITLNILPLLLCRFQQRTVAIPSVNILEIIDLSEYPVSAGTITWHSYQVPLFSLIQLLPFAPSAVVSPSSQEHPQQNSKQLGIVLDVNGKPIVVTVDALLTERELVLKPFDTTIKVPAYVAGCTVLGTGEVIPVLSPHHFGELITAVKQVTVDANETSAVSSVQSEEVQGKTPTILVIDDSVAVRQLLDQILSQSGYQVVQCQDGQEALQTLNQPSSQFDLVISDIEMPRLDGLTFLNEMRALSRWQHLPVVMLTSRANDLHRQKARELGATAYYTKPFSTAELLQCLNALLKSS